jgi:quercetin dioxygenase-like cupin family protein
VFQNGLVRVLDVLVPPGDTTGYHIHANRTIGVAVQAARTWAQTLGAAPDPVKSPTSVPQLMDNWDQALPYTHRVGNADAVPFHYVIGEWLASPGTDTPPLPDHATRHLVKEGAIARIYQVTLLPGAATESHVHPAPGLTVVGTTGALVEEGSTPTASGGAGAGRWSWRNADHRHVLRNVGDTPITLFEIDWR